MGIVSVCISINSNQSVRQLLSQDGQPVADCGTVWVQSQLDQTTEQPDFVVRNGQDVPESLISGRLRVDERFERARMMIVESADR